jgi:hypothetical protein
MTATTDWEVTFVFACVRQYPKDFLLCIVEQFTRINTIINATANPSASVISLPTDVRTFVLL